MNGITTLPYFVIHIQQFILLDRIEYLVSQHHFVLHKIVVKLFAFEVQAPCLWSRFSMQYINNKDNLQMCLKNGFLFLILPREGWYSLPQDHEVGLMKHLNEKWH